MTQTQWREGRDAPLVPVAPEHLLEMPQFKLLLAIIESALANPEGEPDWSIYLSAVRRDEARAAGLNRDVVWPPGTPPELIAEGATPDGLERLLGRWEPHPRFGWRQSVQSLAGLTQQESRVWEMALRGFTEKEIARVLDGQRESTKAHGVALETVHGHLMNGRRKLVALFARKVA